MNTKHITRSNACTHLAIALLGTAMTTAFTPSWAGGHNMHHHGAHHQEHAMHALDSHEHHAPPPGVTRSMASHTLPDVTLIGANGKAVRLSEELAADTPVMVNFIFTTCTAICPITTAVFSQVRDRLMADGKPFRLVSISIDPEQDTPARLRDFAGKFGVHTHGAGADWHFLTGDMASSVAVQRAFGAWRGGKTNHAPLTYVRAAPGTPWVRYEGLVGAETLVEEYHRLTAGLKTVQR